MPRPAARLGFPLDLEWARDAAGRLWWLQARAITAAVSPRTFAVERFFEGVDDGPVTAPSLHWLGTATAPPPEEPGVFRGVGASHGRALEPVRVLRSPDPNAMGDGDVIVVEFADPGWTPLFPRAAAVVMEVGGVMCHAAVVARELGRSCQATSWRFQTRLTAGPRPGPYLLQV